MDRRLVDVCQSGNIEALYALLEDDPSILDLIDHIPTTRTPLHLAVIAQKPDFAREIVRIKPSFMYKFDRYGYCAIHLAAEKGQFEIVKDLLKKDTGLAKLEMGEQKLTPLHCAVVAGKVEVVNLLLDFHPQCIWDLTARKETPLHLAVKNGKVDALLALIKGMNRVQVETLVLKSMDDDDNSVFHLAVSLKQDKVVEALSRITTIQTGIPKDALNQTQNKDDQFNCIKKQNPSREETDTKLSQIIITIPPNPALKSSKQVLIPDFNHIRSITNLRVVTFAVITGLACLFTAIFDPRIEVPPVSTESGNSLVDLCPYFLFMLSNVLGFLLSLAIVVAAAAGSPRRKVLFVILAAVSGTYAFAIISKLPDAYQPIFGLIILATGGSLATVYVRSCWEEYKKQTEGKIDV